MTPSLAKFDVYGSPPQCKRLDSKGIESFFMPDTLRWITVVYRQLYRYICRYKFQSAIF